MKTFLFRINWLWLATLFCLIIFTDSFAQDYSGETWDANTPPAASAGNPTANSLDFETDLFTGKFTYRVPINVAPGRHGTQPGLVLGYNSGMGNGWCGVGWSLDVGYIQRETRKGVPIGWGPTNALTQYDDSKGFVVDSHGSVSRMVCVSGTNQNPMVYRQQVDRSFITYNYYTNNHWEAVDKSGTTYFFGEGLTNQMENSKAGWITNSGESTFRWALDKVVTANGDMAMFSYLNDGGMLYLTNISYNANTNATAIAPTHTVNFILTNRSDTNISFLSGYRVTTKKLLAEIDAKAAGTNVCKYVLNYTNSPSTVRSLLMGVTEFGADYTTAMPQVTFGYQVQSFQFGAMTNWGPETSQGLEDNAWWSSPSSVVQGDQISTLADVNGDGLVDRVMRGVNSGFTNWVVQLNTGSGFQAATNWGGLHSAFTNDDWNSISASEPATVAGDTVNETYVTLADLDGDGLPDRVMRKSLPGPYNQFIVQFNNGSGFNSSTNVGPVTASGLETNYPTWSAPEGTYGGGEYAKLIDINGDGLPDHVIIGTDPTVTNWLVQLNNGSGFGLPNTWASLQSAYTNNQWNSLSANYNKPTGTTENVNETYVELIDINGDGLPDRVMRSAFSPYSHFVVQFNNGVGFEPAETWDLNGQASDVTSEFWGSPEDVIDDFEVLIAGYYYSFFGTSQTLMDVNGDGLPDRVMGNIA
ncbi:MAG TPA: SpvB/TcaC N-terminal domain-containing protein, partial [Verrucomicrobiae bacterium]|nr:SpvB/TcaC N-terminal domain-containing protein [Verrucomicrobiae bacterium]